MNCPHCDRPNRNERRFCGGCGASLTVTCASCEFVNDASDRFCGGCGVATAASSDAHLPKGEVPMLSPAELQALIAEIPTAAAPVVTLPQGPIGQDDLDRLFGGVE